MNKPYMKRIAALASVLICGACGTPKEAIDLSKLTVGHMESLKGQMKTFKDSVNHSREASAARLAIVRARTEHRARRNEDDFDTWKLAGNTTAEKMLQALKSQDDSFKTDPYTLAAFRQQIEDDLKKKYGKLSVKTDKLDAIVERVNLVAEDKLEGGRTQFVVNLILKVATESDLVKERASGRLSKVDDSLGEKATALLKGSEDTAVTAK